MDPCAVDIQPSVNKLKLQFHVTIQSLPQITAYIIQHTIHQWIQHLNARKLDVGPQEMGICSIELVTQLDSNIMHKLIDVWGTDASLKEGP